MNKPKKCIGLVGIYFQDDGKPRQRTRPLALIEKQLAWPEFFAFALVVSLATGFLFGTIPAFKASRDSVAETLKEEARTVGASRIRITVADALPVGQVAFSFLLLATATPFLRSTARAYDIDPGFQTAHLAVFFTNPQQAGYGKAQIRAYGKEVRERVARIPGVESVSWASNMPLWARSVSVLQVEGHQARWQADKISTVVDTVDTNYFETAGVAIKSGREFTPLDQENSTPVAMVNEKMAHDYWPGGDALGKRIQLPGENQMRQIVGVARNASYTNWGEPPQLCVYVPLEQNYGGVMSLYVRTRGNSEQILLPVQREIHAVAPEIVVSNPRTGRQIIDGGLFGPRMGVALLSVFGLLALTLANIGLYGILAYSVNQRRREIGLRMALGAARASVLRLILKQGMSLVVTGVLIGFGDGANGGAACEPDAVRHQRGRPDQRCGRGCRAGVASACCCRHPFFLPQAASRLGKLTYRPTSRSTDQSKIFSLRCPRTLTIAREIFGRLSTSWYALLMDNGRQTRPCCTTHFRAPTRSFPDTCVLLLVLHPTTGPFSC